jgi:hypothetical protein
MSFSFEVRPARAITWRPRVLAEATRDLRVVPLPLQSTRLD